MWYIFSGYNILPKMLMHLLSKLSIGENLVMHTIGEKIIVYYLAGEWLHGFITSEYLNSWKLS